MRIVLTKNMYCRGYYKGESFEYLSETNIYYVGKTAGGSKINIPKHRAELDPQEDIDQLNENIDIVNAIDKLMNEDE